MNENNATITCLICNVLIRFDRVERHFGKMHPRSSVQLAQIRNAHSKPNITSETPVYISTNPSPLTSIETCPDCGINLFSRTELTKHIKKQHSKQAEEKKIALAKAKEVRLKRAETTAICPICNAAVLQKNLKTHNRIEHNIGVPLILVTRRGTRVIEPQTCSVCNKVKSLTWLYKASSRGPVHLCSLCKPKIFDRSFGKKDALDAALAGGSFESSRRRH